MGTIGELKSGLTYNKQLWAVTCGTFLSMSVDAARKQLHKAQSQILSGVCFYKPFSEESEKLLKPLKLDVKTHAFVLNIAKQMNLDALQAWDLMAFYLTHEFRGSEDNFESFLENDTRKEQLVKDICSFYWSERMFLLKCIGIYLAYWKDKDHPYSKAFTELIVELKPTALLQSLLKQLRLLTESASVHSPSNSYPKLMNSTTPEQWMSVYLSEHLAVLHNLILFVDGNSYNWTDVLQTLRLCKHALPYRHKLKRQHLPHLYSITYSQTVLLLRMINVSEPTFAQELWGEQERKLFSDLDLEMEELNPKEEHGPILLAWMLLNFLGPDGEDSFPKYRKFGIMATKLNVFRFLNKLLHEPMFKSESTKIADIAHTTVYKLIDTMACNFEPEQLHPREDLLILFETILKKFVCTERFWQSDYDSGMHVILNMSQRWFPLDFEPFVKIVTSLASASPESCKQAMALVAELSYLVEPIRPALLPLLTRLMDTNRGVKLNTIHRPLPHVDSLILQPGTLGTLEEEPFQSVCWKVKYSFWLAIHSAESTLLNQISLSTGAGVELNAVAKALSSVRCIAACLESRCEIEPPMVLPIEMVFTLVERFLPLSNPKSAMMAACLDVSSCLCLFNEFSLDVTNKLRALDFLPKTQPDEGAVMTYISFAKGHFFNAGVLGRIVVNEERPVGSFPLVRSYLKFLQNLIATGCEEKEQKSVALSGLVYVILEIFPRCFDWGYAALRERTQLCDLCLKLFHRLLNPAAFQSKDNTNKAAFERLLAQTCLYAMLYTDNGLTMLRICSIGEAELKTQMLQQTSWLSGEGVDLISLVRLALSILNRVLLLKDSVKTSKDLSPTEKLIYASPNAKNSLQVVPNIAYYVYHCFNPRMPILAVRLLKRIALEVPMTLRACLAMDGDVIREAFVAKLDSPHQSVQLKVAILELITACIHTQPGATEAFFNIHHPEESRRLFSQDKTPNEDPSGCLTYACNLLARAKDEPSIVRSVLYGAVVELLHALWMHHQKILLSFLRSKKNFWVDLCAPLFLPPSHSVRGYSQVFNILSSELYTFGTQVHEQLMEQLKTFFCESNGYLETWSKFITSSLCLDCKKSSQEISHIEEPSETGNDEVIQARLSLMTAWKDFLLVVLGELQSSTDLTLSKHQQSSLAGHVLKALEEEALRDASPSSINVARPAAVTMLAELLLVLQARWKSSCFSDLNATVSQWHSILMRFSFLYHDLPPRTRTALLSCAIYSIQLLQHTIQTDEIAMELLVKATITMVSFELQALRTDGGCNETPCKLSVTLLQVLCEAVSEACHGPWQILLSHSKIIALVTASLSEALVSQANLLFAHSALYLLLSLAGSNKNVSLLSLPFLQDQLWLQLTPRDRTQRANQLFQAPESWVNSEWASVFCVGLELVSVLLHQHGVKALDIAVNFCAVQESALLDCLLLARHTFEPSALILTEATLKLLVQLVQHAAQWRLLAFRTFCNLVRGVTVCLDICVGLLTRPHLLSSLAEGAKQHMSSTLQSENADSPIKITPKLSTCSNKLMNAIVLSLAVLRQLSPGVAPLLCDRELDVDSWSLLLEPSWSAPAQPGLRQNMNCLTFGTLLAAVNLFSFTAAALKPGSSTSRHTKASLTRGRRVTASPGRLVGASSGTDQDSCDPGGSASWVPALEFDKAQLGLQMSLALLASQGLLIIRAKEYRDHSVVRRELSTEMSQYVELMRRTFGENMDSDKDPVPLANLSTVDEQRRTASTDHARIVRRLELQDSPESSSFNSDTGRGHKTIIYSCSDSDYLRLMAHIFQRVFRE